MPSPPSSFLTLQRAKGSCGHFRFPGSGLLRPVLCFLVRADALSVLMGSGAALPALHSKRPLPPVAPHTSPGSCLMVSPRLLVPAVLEPVPCPLDFCHGGIPRPASKFHSSFYECKTQHPKSSGTSRGSAGLLAGVGGEQAEGNDVWDLHPLVLSGSPGGWADPKAGERSHRKTNAAKPSSSQNAELSRDCRPDQVHVAAPAAWPAPATLGSSKASPEHKVGLHHCSG